MTNQIIMWLLGILSTLLTAAIIGLVKVVFDLRNRIARLEMFNELMLKNSMLVMRSPHTPELDILIDKYRADETLTSTEWQRMQDLGRTAMVDKEETHGYRQLAALADTLATHKLKGIYRKRQEELEGVGAV